MKKLEFCGRYRRIEEKLDLILGKLQPYGNIIEILTKLEKIMATVPAGLAALQQADTDLKNAVVANTTSTGAAVTSIQASLAVLAANEDPAVQAAAADIEAQVAAIAGNTSAIQNALNPTPAV